MEDIKKAIEEASQNYSLQFAEDYREEAKDDFKHGAEWMRNKLEESERWRKVEEELPEKKDKGYFILVRSGDIMDAYYVYPDTNYACLRDWEEWKPIH